MIPPEIASRMYNSYAYMLTVLDKKGPLNGKDLARELGINPSTSSSRKNVLEDFGCVYTAPKVDNKRLVHITELGKEVAKAYRKGRRFMNTVADDKRVTQGLMVGAKGNWVAKNHNRKVKKAPKWTHGVIYEDAKVRREIPRFVPHAPVLPWKGKNSLAE